MHFQFRDITENRAPAGDIVALGGETRHAQAEPRGVLRADEEHERAQVLLRRAGGCKADHAELKRAADERNTSYSAGLKMTFWNRGEERRGGKRSFNNLGSVPQLLSGLNVREDNEKGSW